MYVLDAVNGIGEHEWKNKAITTGQKNWLQKMQLRAENVRRVSKKYICK